MAARIDLYSDEEFLNIVNLSSSMAEVAQKLGYTSHSGSNGERIRKRIDQLNISTDHFKIGNKRPIKRNEENIFIENSTANHQHYENGIKKVNTLNMFALFVDKNLYGKVKN